MKGFTAFREEQEIDFTHLEVFAIAGPTGSGKSSILDAMTYALYGEIDRVGIQCGQLVSQGLSRMAVTFDFRVGRDDFRITRSTPAQGPARVALERLVAGHAESYGEGADRVREVREIVRGIIGMDYDGFTRSVILPQGKFAEFLTGDPKKRREILTDLLGLGLFDRMGKRANSIARDAKYQSDAKRVVVEREYADVAEDLLAAAQAHAKTTANRQGLLATAAKEVAALAREGEESRRIVEELRDSEREARSAAATAEDAVGRLGELAAHVSKAEAAVQARSASAQESDKAHSSSTTAREAAEAKWGTLVELVKARAKAEELPKLEVAENSAKDLAAKARAKDAPMAEMLGKRIASLAAATDAVAEAATTVLSAKADLEEVEHANKVAALVVGLKKGDPCPVCAKPLQSVPRPAMGELLSAKAALTAAEQRKAKADEFATAARIAVEGQKKDLAALKTEIDRCDRDEKQRTAERAAAVQALKGLLGAKMPPDPSAFLAQRVSELTRLTAAEKEAAEKARKYERDLAEAEQDRTRLDASITRERTRLEINAEPLLARATKLGLAKEKVPARPALPPAGKGIAALVAAGRTIAGSFSALAEQVGRIADERSTSGPALLAKGLKATAGLVPAAADIGDLNESVQTALKNAIGEAAAAKLAASALSDRLASRKKFEQEIAELADRAHVFSSLALELRADRIVAFLQAEALRVMAASASAHLGQLSDDRYALVCREDDQFFVLDKWNGDEERSVRTLSGGETFLASLSLALGLSEQVRSLAVTERARLDSLFLDEGFGSLDPDALKVVIEAIHQLGGDGRLVGVITHVRDLTDQFVRIEVEKSPGGSRLRLVE